jgi:hypothetical protein
MLQWSPRAVLATMGAGGLGLVVFYSELFAQWKPAPPAALVVGIALAPMLVFMLPFDPPGPWARRAQWAAIGGYGVGVLVSLVGLAQGGFAPHDLFFILFVALGAWPCGLAAYRLAFRLPAPTEERVHVHVAPDPSLEPGDRRVVLRAVRGKWVRIFLVMAALCAIAATPGYQRVHPVLAWATLAFCGLGAFFAATQFALPAARGSLALDATGLTMRAWGREHRTAWSDIQAFRPMQLSGARMIELVYRPGCKRQRNARRFAAGLTGVEGAILDHYEVSGAALAALLERWRERYGAPEAAVAPSVP